uniref:Uncharacterized protein n=1 Tax=Physcomitrium patens TaxID=3218 RepID=A0A7I4DSZ5_PHYPA
MFCPSNSVDYGRHSSCCNGRCGTDFLRCQHLLRWHQGWHASLDFANLVLKLLACSGAIIIPFVEFLFRINFRHRQFEAAGTLMNIASKTPDCTLVALVSDKRQLESFLVLVLASYNAPVDGLVRSDIRRL